jgi:hypothetical protein
MLGAVMMSRLFIGLALIVAVVACGDVTAPSESATTAHGLLVSIAVPGRCIFTCDPISPQLNHLGLVTLTNTATTKVFFRECGGAPAIGEQQFVNGQWINVGPAVTCAVGPLSAVIQPHDSVQFNMWFGAGTWRLTLGAAADSALATEALSTSAPIALQ